MTPASARASSCSKPPGGMWAPGVSLEWGAGLALAAGATEDEIAEVLLAIAPVTGLGRVVAAAPDLGTALGYDVATALEDPDDR